MMEVQKDGGLATKDTPTPYCVIAAVEASQGSPSAYNVSSAPAVTFAPIANLNVSTQPSSSKASSVVTTVPYKAVPLPASEHRQRLILGFDRRYAPSVSWLSRTTETP